MPFLSLICLCVCVCVCVCKKKQIGYIYGCFQQFLWAHLFYLIII